MEENNNERMGKRRQNNSSYVQIYTCYGKGKQVKLPLCLINKAQYHGDVLRSGGIAPSFLFSTVYGGEWSASSPIRFTSGERLPST
jgi:hypothetical protein